MRRQSGRFTAADYGGPGGLEPLTRPLLVLPAVPGMQPLIDDA